MATEPNYIKIVLEHERLENVSERYPTTRATYYIAADEAEIRVERDLEIRCQDPDGDTPVQPRSVEQIADELGKHDYNCAKKQLRHIRYRSATSRDDEVEVSVVDVTPSSEGVDPAETWTTTLMVREALAKLNPKDRLVVEGIHMRGFTQAQIAKVLGVSQPAVAKRLRKAEGQLRELLT